MSRAQGLKSVLQLLVNDVIVNVDETTGVSES